MKSAREKYEWKAFKQSAQFSTEAKPENWTCKRSSSISGPTTWIEALKICQDDLHS
ncbi:hypothetical protein RchiOBHm_Chr0c31g0501311 [Rosa chinensis]|uniref:Uncharacterized protein n=1 Tax=Rosa chinensis TaxID=74649 RepID=A0A2P6SQ91_ROSCH|nr:hypothetical protein RchiOBHm_Chr1g0365781 [Rosa chinensis]PRQ60860.1 hypothetical protein RchiOBHm_Chr0c31g0501311 [Rosa chinensis]